MTDFKLLLLITVIIFSSELVKIFCTNNGHLNTTLDNKTPGVSENKIFDSSTDGTEFEAYYFTDRLADRYYNNQILANEFPNTTLTFYTEKPSVDLVKEWIDEKAVAEDSRKSEEKYDENNTLASASWNSSQYRHKLKLHFDRNASSILELNGSLMIESKSSPVPVEHTEKPECLRNHKTRKWPFLGSGFFFKRCTGRRRPLRCRRFRRRRRRRTTTARPSAMLANFTFVNNVNNQNYLTQSSGSNVTQLTNSSFPSPKE